MLDKWILHHLQTMHIGILSFYHLISHNLSFLLFCRGSIESVLFGQRWKTMCFYSHSNHSVLSFLIKFHQFAIMEKSLILKYIEICKIWYLNHLFNGLFSRYYSHMKFVTRLTWPSSYESKQSECGNIWQHHCIIQQSNHPQTF